MAIIQAKILWQNGSVVDCPQDANLNCDTFNLTAIRDVWIVRHATCCGGQSSNITFSDPGDGSMKGVWVEAGDQGMVIDSAGGVDDVVAKCNACCGEPTDVAPAYGAGYPAIPGEATSKFCVKRNDNGGYLAISNAMMDYQGDYVTMVHKQNKNGVSVYEMDAFKQPVPRGVDIITAGVCAALAAEVAVTDGGGGPQAAAAKKSPTAKAGTSPTEGETETDVAVAEDDTKGKTSEKPSSKK